MLIVNPLHQTTPELITPAVRKALRQVAESEPFFIHITPLPGTMLMSCYPNVDLYIAREGGTREEGWTVYEGWGGRYLKLIHHALWRTSDGQLLDITPSDESRNLILPDAPRFAGVIIPARYIILDPRPEVAETVAYCEQLDLIQYRLFSGDFRGNGARRDVRFDRPSKPQPIRRAVRSLSVGRNARCPCGSGKKFKNCCLRAL